MAVVVTKVKSAMVLYQKINVTRNNICVESFMLLWTIFGFCRYTITLSGTTKEAMASLLTVIVA